MQILSQSEELSKRGLTRIRALALFLLFLMVAIYVCSLLFESNVPADLVWTVPWVRAFSEAAMVGALADWFAVTALFRRPFGLPIPHTAIIPRNKDRIGVTLGEFVRTNFLTADVISSKIRHLKPSASFSLWLNAAANRVQVTTFAAGGIREFLSTTNDAALRALFTDVLRDTVDRTNFADAGAKVLDLLIADHKHTALFASILKLLERGVETHHTFIREKVREGMPWWVPGFLHDRVYDTLIGKFKDTLHEVNNDEHHILREKINEALKIFVDKLRSDEITRSEANSFKTWLLTQPVATEYAGKLFQDLKEHLLIDVNEPNSRTIKAFDEILSSVSAHLTKDAAAQDRIDSFLERAAIWGADRYGHQITKIIAETVQSWDTATLVQKIELEVGRDLQFVRINGTVVGGLVGLLLHAITTAFLS